MYLPKSKDSTKTAARKSDYPAAPDTGILQFVEDWKQKDMDNSDGMLDSDGTLGPVVSPKVVDEMRSKKAEIDMLESQLQMLDVEEQLAQMQLQVRQKQAVVDSINRSAASSRPDNQGPPYSLGNGLLDTRLGLATHKPAQSVAGMTSYRAYLGLGDGYEDCYYYDILQFIEDCPAGLALSKGKSGVHKTSAGKVTPEWETDLLDVSPTQWTGASVKILSRLIADGEIDNEGMLQHLAYILRISRHASKHTWRSVLLYDRQCRIMQAATKSGWDVEPTGVGSTILIPDKRAWQEAQSSAQQRPQTADTRKDRRFPPTPASGSSEICRMFNTGRCGFRPCRYRHCCNICGGPHPAWQHPVPTAWQGQATVAPGADAHVPPAGAFVPQGVPQPSMTPINHAPAAPWGHRAQQAKNM